MRTALVRGTLLALALAAPLAAQLSPTDQRQKDFFASATWQEFVASSGGQWRAEWCAATGTAKAIYGTGLAIPGWTENSLAAARRHANELLVQRAELLGLGASDFREVIGARMGRTWSFTFDQHFRGLPVIGGRADVRVSMSGRIAMFGSRAFAVPADFDTTPAIDGDTALLAAWQALGQLPTGTPQPAAVAAPQLVLWADVEADALQTPRLAWEVAISNVNASGEGPIGRYYVDARNGQVLHFTNDKHECGFSGCTYGAPPPPPVLTTVTVMAWTRTGNDGFSALVNVPLPGLQLTVPGIGAVTTDQNGQFQINIASTVSITVSNLDGRHHDPIQGGSAPSGSFNVSPGVNTTIQLLTSGASFNQGAHTTTSWWTDRTNEFCRSILGNSSQLNTADAVVPTVNIGQNCNAFYSGNTINFYEAGSGCNNTAFSTVVAHEWGHGLDDRYGGISQTNGLSEGWGDIIGLYLVDSPILGSGFETPGVGIRNGNNTRQYPDGGGVHSQGESWMGMAWNFRDRLELSQGSRAAAIAISNDTVIGSIVADATNQADAALEVFLADDDDGNLNNGTPHAADLVWACDNHSLPHPVFNPLTNDECAAAIDVVNGLNGPFSNVGASTSSPAWACAIGGNDVWFRYLVGQSGTLTVSTCGQATYDSAIQVFAGSCGALTSLGCNDDACSLQSSLSVPVTAGYVYIRVGGYNSLTGSFSLDVNGPAGTLASASTYGSGCYRWSKAFYELFASGAFDLQSRTIRLVRSGNRYLGLPGGVYLPPSGSAQVLSLTDDSSTTVSLNGSFGYIGGSTSTLTVCSNGFVSIDNSNGTGYSPTASAWLASTAPRWGTWHDFNPTAGGAVKFEQIGAVAYITWDGVFSFNTSTANTWQLQFDLGTGAVTYVWPNVPAASNGNGWLVGYAATTPNADLGSLDLSTALLAGGLSTGVDNRVPLALTSTLPQLGATAILTTTEFPAGSLLGIQEVSLTKIDPGIDLAFLGMPDCLQHCGLDALYAMFPIGGQASYGLVVPNNPTLMGAELAAQSVAFDAPANAAGLVTSNGVTLVLGL